MVPYQRIQEGIKWSTEKEIGRGRESPQHNRRVAGESSEARQKPETEQSKRKNIGEKCSAPTGKCTAQGRLQ